MAALSLKCNTCGVALRSMREAQDHGEATGHADFSESTEAVLTLVCADCGKPCRSQTEVDVHTKRTGHTTFTDKTAEAAKPMDSEAQMRQLRAEEAGLDAPPAAGGDAAMADAGAEGGAAEPDGELITPEVPAAVLATLVEMGFGENRATRALYATGTDTAEVAVNWIMEHEGDADIDTQLLVPKNKIKPKLSKEEMRAQAEALRKTVLERREREEKEAERLREKERIRSGKELLQAKRIEEDQERRRNIEWRKREKEEEAKAREKIRLKLAEDKRERRRKLGLPEEPTPEELAEEAAKAAAKAAEEAARKAAFAPAVRPVSVAEKLRAELVGMKRAHEAEAGRFAACCNTLLTYCGNIAREPGEDKFRRIRLGNAAFQQRVGTCTGGLRFLELLGFQTEPTGEFLVMPADKVSVPVLNAAGAELNSALSNPFFGVL